MGFNIHEFDNLECFGDDEWEAFEKYQEVLFGQFANSPEGKKRIEEDPEMGFWIFQFMIYGLEHVGVHCPK